MGPRITAAERLKQSHHRVERGTSCWLQGICERANAFDYDADIAERLKNEWRQHPEFGASTIWVTVQGRVVYLEGCTASDNVAERLEAFARGLPQVMQAVASVSNPKAPRTPYSTWASRFATRQ